MRSVLLFAWLGISTILFPALFLPFLVPRQAYSAMGLGCIDLAPQSSLLNSLAAGFLCIFQGRINSAVQLSWSAVPLFAALIWNELVALWYTFGQLARTFQKMQTPNETADPAIRPIR